jgi:hypothetical protein
MRPNPLLKETHMGAPSRTRALALIAASAALAASAPAAAGANTASETIKMHWQTPGAFNAPYKGTGMGSFSASGVFNDAGLFMVSYELGGAPSPSVDALHSDRTLYGALGNIVLNCNEITHDFANVTGECNVTAGTGDYVGLHGQGPLTGTVTMGPPFVFDEVLELSM